MGAINTSIDILAVLKKWGCEQVCLCPGGRNAPFVEVLSKSSIFEVKTFYEERSAAFFALGLMKTSDRPAAIITTSGTAVAEVLPAAIEAYHSGLPLIIVSADRPKSYRGSGAPQTILQSKIFANFSSFQFDLDSELAPLNKLTDSPKSPVHLNICFDEPLLNQDELLENYDKNFTHTPAPDHLVTEKRQKLAATKSQFVLENKYKKPLIILGPLARKDQFEVKKHLLSLKVPIYAEAHSGLKNDDDLKPYLIQSGASFASKIFDSFHFDSIIRIGGVPTLRLWRDMEKRSNINIVNFSALPFSGLSWLKAKNLDFGELKLLKNFSFQSESDLKKIFTKDQNFSNRQDQLLNDVPRCEPNFFKKISQSIKKPSNIFIANSLPIREWDLASTDSSEKYVFTNRGANGIDGLLSTFLGLCEKNKTNYCILGDLSALYDLNGAWIYKQYLQEFSIKIIIINNGGGKIFSPLFDNSFFENQHDISFSHWAKMFSLGYQKISSVDDLNFKKQENEVIEIIPDPKDSLEFLKRQASLLKETFGA